MTLDLRQCTKSCENCVRKYVSKHSLKKGDSFRVNCTGIPETYISEDLLLDTNTDMAMAQAMLDPVTWAKHFLDWHCLDPQGEVWSRKHEEGSLGELPPYKKEQALAGKSIFNRPYQAEMLRCTSKRKVFRLGRQSGKCLAMGSMIQMADGTLCPVEDFKDGQHIACLDGFNIATAPAFKVENGIKECARLELMDGRSITASLNHPFLVRSKIGREKYGTRAAIFGEKWVELGDLQPNDYIAIPHKLPEGKESLDINSTYKLSVLGLMIADGNMTGNNCRFSNNNPYILEHLRLFLKGFNCKLKQYDCDAEVDYHIVCDETTNQHGLKRWLREIGLFGLNGHEKYIPDFVMQLRNADIAVLLHAMYGCDGWASVDKTGKPEVGYCTVSERLAKQLVSLLARFGIYATTRLKTTILNDKKFFSRQVIISRQRDVVNFIENIGLMGKDQQALKARHAALAQGKSPKTDAYEDEDILFVPIRSIVAVGEKMTWDLTVPKYHTLIADNIVSHNTETLCVSMLFNIYTRSNFKVVLITPYQAQIEMIFGRLNEMIDKNPLLANSRSRNVKAPNYRLELYNGSRILGFTAGTKSGQDAGAARGQPAQMLVFDEADYLSPADIDSSLAMITNFPDATVWMSSTPTGRREKFFYVCHDKFYKEFHFPSHINPNWTPELDEFFRGQFTEDGYKHEILAEFGEQEEGVYQNKYVEAAQADYEYGELRDPTWTYTIGVDWNDIYIGTTIAVTGFNPRDGKFYVVDKKIISRSEFTQLSACETIASFNRLWSPVSIYVDKGYGATQVEVLRKYGKDAITTQGATSPDARLATIVKAYDFGGSVETRDLFTKQPVKKHAKPFLVESSVRRFETLSIKYPKSDHKYTASLLGYIVDRTTNSGMPVYRQQNEAAGDHFLDAVNLSLVAYVLEKTDFGKPLFESKITFSINPLKEMASSSMSPERTNLDSGNSSSRTSTLSSQEKSMFSSGLPAANTNIDRGVGLWAWPGFERDEPRPGKVLSRGRSLFGRGRRSPPKRNRF